MLHVREQVRVDTQAAVKLVSRLCAKTVHIFVVRRVGGNAPLEGGWAGLQLLSVALRSRAGTHRMANSRWYMSTAFLKSGRCIRSLLVKGAEIWYGKFATHTSK